MMARSLRHLKIIEIISQEEIETQEELCSKLITNGFSVTQATVSRDIKELGLIKTLGSQKKYKYEFIERQTTKKDKAINLFKESVLSIIAAKNLVLVKTLSGNGSSAGMCVDKLNYEEVLGSVAGDDTLLIVTNSDECALAVTKKLEGLLK